MDTTYVIKEVLSTSKGAVLYRGVRAADGQPVVLKVLAPQHRSQHLTWLKNEYSIESALNIPAAVRPIALETYEGRPALVMEDFGGESLDRAVRPPMDIAEFLRLAIRIVSAVADIHQRNVVHKDLKPDNILVHPTTGEVKLIDFGLASTLPCHRQESGSLRQIEGSLPYMSPEQTGRMNRAPDERSDLYSLGVTFCQMLTGELPFQATDPLEWVHCHIARSPIPPAESAPWVPDVVSAILMKLLAKEAEDRYQSARGLRHDLERCLEPWSSRGTIEPFPLGERDVSDRFQIPQKLYGRDREISELLCAFERVVRDGVPELLLVSGHAGIGKSALVRELEKPIVRERGFFASGKFEQYKRDVPYATIVAAFTGVVDEILAESEEKIAAWKERLLSALGANGQLIVDVIPPVELIIGRQPNVPSLPPAEAQSRFKRVFQRFIGVFARRPHPLALFLDDLQWADPASLELLQDVMTRAEARHLLVIGAYRDNEVPPSHPLTLALDRVRKEGARVADIVLGPLSSEHLTALISDTLHCSRERAAPLSRLVEEKTAGNPFFVIQLLTALHDERLIELDALAEAWRWDMAKIYAKGVTDNVIDLMVEKLARLPERTQKALRQLACVGSTAEISILTRAFGRSEQDLYEDLSPAVRAGLILRLEGAYQFAHDRVQEAAYSLVPKGERAAAHLEIGRLLLSRTAAEELEEKIFEIVNQLDRGAALITSRDERVRVAELELIAGKRAKRSTAYASALRYLAAGSALLAGDSWDRRYELTFALELNRAECEYLTGSFEAAEERLRTLARKAKDLIDAGAVACVQIVLYATQTRNDRAIDAGLHYLRRIGIEWSPQPTREDVRHEYESMQGQLGSRPIEELLDLPPVTDARWQTTMDVLTVLMMPAAYSDEQLLCLVACRMVNLSLEHGHCDGSCLAYTYLGSLLGPFFGDYQAGFRFGKLGLDLLEKRGQLRFRAFVYAFFGMAINPWTKPLRGGIEWLRRALGTAVETGDLAIAGGISECVVTLLLAGGEPLDETQREAERSLALTRKARFGLFIDVGVGKERLIRTLRGLSPSFSSFNDEQFDENQFEAHLAGDPSLLMAKCWYWIRKLEARFYAGDYASALAAAAVAEPILWITGFVFERAEYHFYRALALAAHHDEASPDDRRSYREALLAHLRQLEAWASSCPENFGSRAALVAAEEARLGGEAEKAAHLYEQAIRSARDNGFVNNEAIAYETAARFYRARGFDQIADGYLREARARYVRWGADGKVRQLDRLYPGLVERRSLAPTATLAVGAERLDVLSVVKASQAISREIVLDDLLSRLVEVVIQQAGAQKGYVILCRKGGLTIEAEALLDEKEAASVKLLRSLPATPSPLLPASIITYVSRTKRHVLLANAAEAPTFSSDEHIARTRPKSVLCLPILRQAELVGMLYLENNLVTGAFTSEHTEVLELLAAQAAISLNSALCLAEEQAARAAAEQAERRMAFLAQASVLLNGSIDYEQVLGRLASLSVRELADSFVIDVIEDAEVKRIAGMNADPAEQVFLGELARLNPLRPGSRSPAARAMRTGEPVLLPTLTDAEIRANCADGEHARLIRAMGIQSALSVPLIARGKPIGAITFGSAKPGRYGSADLRLAEELARRVAIAIDNARLHRQTVEALRLREEFLSVASHELRTPMTSLTLALQAMLKAGRAAGPLESSTLRNRIELAHAQGQRLNRLIDELLEVSQIDTNELPLDLAEVDLAAVVREVVTRLELNLARAGCAVSIHDEGPAVGFWDRSRLDQVVTNLLSNAIKFGASKPVEIHIGHDAGISRLVVKDHGIGIETAQTARIFERFARAVSTRHYGGLGLGLYISRSIVQAHGGSIRVESQLGEGAAFTVELPCSGPRKDG
ncbi:AAA family ATPase [Sorangium sp. So ce363]|uniref:AAA family ATPase n=1 Tax=Sorangium sp. So ce363 TaxID=3133304 RepID=UPI003F63E9CC